MKEGLDEPRSPITEHESNEKDGTGQGVDAQSKMMMSGPPSALVSKEELAILNDPKTSDWVLKNKKKRDATIGIMKEKQSSKTAMHFLPPRPVDGASNVQWIPRIPTTAPPTEQAQSTGSPLPEPSLHRMTAAAPTSRPGALAVAGMQEGMNISSGNHNRDALEEQRQATAPAGASNDLAVANLVDPEDQNPQLPQASAASSAESARRLEKTREWKRKVALAVVAFIVLALVIVVPIVVTQNKKDNPSAASIEITVAPSPGPTERTPTLEEYIKSLFPASTWEAWKDPNSPQSLAYDWLMEDIPHLLRFDLWAEDPQAMLLEPPYSALSSSTITRIYQRFALVALYYSTGGETWYYQNNWLDHTVSECLWETSPNFHVQPVWSEAYHGYLEYFLNTSEPMPPTCNPGEGLHYEHLWLDTNNLDGTLPDELYLMTALKSFSSTYNNLKGTLSTKIGLLTNMEGIAILNAGDSVEGDGGRSALGPSIPTEIGLLSNLEVFSTMYLNFQGSVPTEFWALRKLKHFNFMYSPELTGTIPTEIGLITTLRMMNWFHCDYSGTVPSELGLLSDLRVVLVGGDSISKKGRMWGTIPTELGQLSSMIAFFFQDSSFTGTIPSQLGLLRGLYRFKIEHTDMTGTIPSELGLTALRGVFRLGHNHFSGTIPSQLGLLTELKELEFKDNDLSGPVPSQLGLCTDMTFMHFQNNKLTGSLPTEIGVLQPLLHTMYFQNNTGITGKVPEHFCNLNDTCLPVVDTTQCPPEPGFKFDCSATLCGCECQC